MQAKISGHEKTGEAKFLTAPFTALTEIVPHVQDPKSAKHPQISLLKCRKLRRSISASDLSFKSHDNDDLSEELLQDLKKMQLEHPSALESDHKDLPVTHSESYKPLPYSLEDDGSESNDFSTLSGMLRYINREVRLLKKPPLQAATGLSQACTLHIAR